MGTATNTIFSNWTTATVTYEGDTGFTTSAIGEPRYWYSTVPLAAVNTLVNPGYTISTWPSQQANGSDMWGIDIEGNLHPIGQKEIPDWDE